MEKKKVKIARGEGKVGVTGGVAGRAADNVDCKA